MTGRELATAEVRSSGVTVSPWPDHHRFAASVTFDGGYVQAADAALPVLRAEGVASTWYLVAGAVGGSLEGRAVAGWDRWRAAVAAGDVEIGNHTTTHPLVRRSPSETARWAISPTNTVQRIRRIVRREPRHAPPPPTGSFDPVGRAARWTEVFADAVAAQRVLQWQLDRPVETFAYPNGRAHPRLARALADLGIVAMRTTDGGPAEATGDLQAVPGHLFTTATTSAEVDRWVHDAASSGGWYVDVHHLITGDRSSTWSTTPQLFEHVLRQLRRNEAWCATVAAVARQLQAAKEVQVEATRHGGALHLTKLGAAPVTVRTSVPRSAAPTHLVGDGSLRVHGPELTWAAPSGRATAVIS